MMANTPDLPEGTDTVTEPGGAPAGTETTGAAVGNPPAEPSRVDKARQTLRDEAYKVRDQATDKARGYARQGKDKTTTTLRDVSKALDDAATSVDDRLGEQYGEYARMAATAVGDFAGKIEAKDVDDLLKDAENMVRKSPAVAVGLAAAVGFALARVVKSGLDDVDNSVRGRAPGTDVGNPESGGTSTSE